MFELAIFMGIPYLIFVIFLVINTIKAMISGRNQPSNILLLASEIIFTIIGPVIGFYRFDSYGAEIPFNKHHVLSIILLVIISSASFWFAKITHRNQNPLLRIIFSIGILQGILLCLITSIHFIPFIAMGIIYPFLGFELLSPVIALLFLLKEFYFYNNAIFNYDELLPYRKELGFIPLPQKIMQLPIISRIAVYLSGLTLLLCIEISIAYLFGQEPDSIIKAFTNSVGFIFSKQH